MQPPSPLLPFGQDIDFDESLGSDPSNDATSTESAVHIAVPRVERPSRRAADPLAVNARLLAVATEHLRRFGPDRVTVIAIAAEMGRSHGGVYRYFPSRDALLDAVAGHWLRDVEAELARISDAPDPAYDKIEHLLTALANFQRDALAHEPNLFAVHLNATAAGRPVARRHRVRLRSLVERVVEKGIAAGTFRTRDRERAIAYNFDASYRFTHPLPIQQDADLPRDLVDARLGAVILAIQKVLQAGTF